MLLNSFLFLSAFSVFLNNYLRTVFYSITIFSDGLLTSLFSANKCTMCSSYLFSASSCFSRFSWSKFFRVQVFEGPGFSDQVFQGPSFSGIRFFRIQVFLGQSPGSGSRFWKKPNCLRSKRMYFLLFNVLIDVL